MFVAKPLQWLRAIVGSIIVKLTYPSLAELDSFSQFHPDELLRRHGPVSLIAHNPFYYLGLGRLGMNCISLGNEKI